MGRQRLVAGVIASVFMAATYAGLSAATTVGSPVSICAEQHAGNSDIAIDPTGPLHMAVFATDRPNHVGYTAFCETSNGGSSWSSAVVTANSGWLLDWWPSVVFDANGSPFMAVVRSLAFTTTGQVMVAHRGHGGFAQVYATPANMKAEYASLAVDRNDSLPNPLYVAWSDATNASAKTIKLSRSLDGGSTFTPATVTDSAGAVGYTQPAVSPDGEVYVIWSRYAGGAGQLTFDRSDDHGVTWGADRVVHTWVAPADSALLATDAQIALKNQALIATIDVDRSSGPHRGAVYVAYYDGTGLDSYGIYIRRSEDRGETWSEPVRVDRGSGGMRYGPTIAVDETDGSVHVSWFDTRSSQANYRGVFYARSSDGGVSFAPDKRVTSDYSHNGTPYGAQVTGLAAHDNRVQSTWPGEYWTPNTGLAYLPLYTATITTPRASFTLSASPAAQTAAHGSVASYAVSATNPTDGFNAAIDLTVSGLPAGATASLSNTTMEIGSSATLTVDAGSAASGTYTVTVTGKSGAVSNTASVSLVVSPSFTMTASPSALTLPAGGSAAVSMTSEIWNSFNSSIDLSASGMPAGVSVKFTPDVVAAPGGGVTTAIVSATAAAVPGAYSLTITASGGGVTRPVVVPLTITSGGASTSFALGMAPGSPVTYGQTVAITATSAPGAGTVTFTDNGVELASGVPLDPAGRASISPRFRAGAHALAARLVPAGGASPAAAAMSLLVDKAPLTITAGDGTRVYGAPTPGLAGVIAGAQAGDPITATFTTAAATVGVGSYAIVPTASDAGSGALANYALTLVNGTLTVTRAPLTVKAGHVERLYGDANPPFFGTASALVNGDTFASLGLALSFATNATPLTPVGDVPVTTTGPPSSDNYTIAYAEGSMTIYKKPLVVKAAPVSRVYGTANPPLVPTFTGFANGEVLATSGVTGQPVLATNATVTSVPQNYSITASKGTLASANYELVFGITTLTITKAPLVANVGGNTRPYGGANGLAVSYTGFVAGDTVATAGITGAAALSTAATVTSPPGSYPVSASVGTLASPKYTFTAAGGLMTVVPAPLLVRAQDRTVTYGATDFSVTAAITGFAAGQSLANSDVTGEPEIYTAADASSSPGTSYPIAVTAGTLASTNYAFVFVGGTFSILNPAGPYETAVTVVTAHSAAFEGGASYDVRFTSQFGNIGSYKQLHGYVNGVERGGGSTDAQGNAQVWVDTQGMAPGFYPGAVLITFDGETSSDYRNEWLLPSSTTADLDIDGVVPSITWTKPASISLGTALSDAQLNAIAPVPGAFSYSPSAGTILSPGSHAVTVTFTPDDLVSFAQTTSTQVVVVSQATEANALRLTELPRVDGQVVDARALSNNGVVVGSTNGSQAHPFRYENGIAVRLADPAGTTFGRALAVNSSGYAGGFANSSGLIWSPSGVMTKLGTLGGTSAQVQLVNAAGHFVGVSTRANGTTGAFLYRGDPALTMVDLGTLGPNMQPKGINASDQIVGTFYSASNVARAFIYSNGVLTNLGTLGGSESYGVGITDAGVVGGVSRNAADFFHAFVRDSAGLVDLGALGGYASYIDLVSPAGPMAGHAYMNDQSVRTFVYENGALTTLDTFGDEGWVQMFPTAVNASGQVAGNYTTSGYSTFFLYTGGKVYDLHALLPAGSPWTITSVLALNDRGQLLLTARNGNQSAVFLTDPIPAGGWAESNAAPVVHIVAPATIPLNGARIATVTLDGAGSTDDGFAGPLTYEWTDGGGAVVGTSASISPALGLGTHTFRLTVHDGELSSQAEAVVNVVDDTPPTVIPVISGISGGSDWFTSDVAVGFTVTDLESDVTSSGCEAAAVAADTSGVTFTCAATSAGGGASETVTIKRDTVAPTLTVPASQTVEATDAQGALVTYASAQGADAGSGLAGALCSVPSDAVFPIGETTVTCTAIDNAGLTTSGSFLVTVTPQPPPPPPADTVAPVISVPAAMTVSASTAAGASVTFVASATDDVDGAVAATCIPSSGSTFVVGTTTVSCSATDAAGNAATASFAVTVSPLPTVIDRKPPKLDLPERQLVEATGPAGATVSFTASATDLVDGSVPVTCAPASGSQFPVGRTTVTCAASDRAGNTKTGTFVVNVRDTTDPVIVSVTPSVTSLPSTNVAVPVTIAVVATDIVDASPFCRITRVTGGGQDVDNDGVIDWTITGDLSLSVEAVARRKRDRTYTIVVKCTDVSGNTSVERTAIVVSKKP